MRKGVIGMDEFLEKLKNGAIRVRDEAGKIAETAVSKTKEVVDKTKCNYAISGIEKKIDVIMISLGEVLYSEYKDGAVFDDEIVDKCRQIDDLIEEINAVKSKMAEMGDVISCANCGEIVPSESAFCPKCGNKID